MYCSKCGKENTEDALFCTNCGNSLNKTAYEPDVEASAKSTDESGFAEQIIPEQNTTEQNIVSQDIPEQKAVVPDNVSAPVNKTKVQLLELYKSKRVKMIVAFVLLGLFLVSVIAFLISETNPRFMPAEQFNSQSAEKGQYVTTDIGLILELYSYGTESGSSTTWNYCLARNTNGDLFMIKAPHSYYKDNLAKLVKQDINDISYIDSVTVYGTVNALDMDLVEKIKEDWAENSEFEDVLLGCTNIDILSEPKMEDYSALIGIPMVLILPLIISLVLYSKSKNRYFTLKRKADDYGDPLEIIRRTRAKAWFADKAISADNDYIVSNVDEAIVSTKEILCLYQYVHKTNFVVDDVALIAINKYGEQIKFKYKLADKDEIAKTAMKLLPLCPKAVLGYDKKSLAYIAKNREIRK